jgi:hypothetical protein
MSLLKLVMYQHNGNTQLNYSVNSINHLPHTHNFTIWKQVGLKFEETMNCEEIIKINKGGRSL